MAEHVDPLARGEQPERERVPLDEDWERDQDAIMVMLKADPANWKPHVCGGLYYCGPRMQGDGMIDWSGDDGWPA